MASEPCEIADLARCSLHGCEYGAWTGVITTLGFLVAFAIEQPWTCGGTAAPAG